MSTVPAMSPVTLLVPKVLLLLVNVQIKGINSNDVQKMVNDDNPFMKKNVFTHPKKRDCFPPT